MSTDPDKMTAREEFNTLYGDGIPPKKETDGGDVVKADFVVKLQSDTEPPAGDPGKSLVQEVAALRTNVAQLCQAVRGLVTLISVLDRKVDAALKGGTGNNVGCM